MPMDPLSGRGCPPALAGWWWSGRARRRGGLAPAGEDLPQPGRERLRLARLAVLAAEEPGVPVGERDGRDPEPFGDGMRAAVGQLALRLLAGRQDDAGRCRPERVDIRCEVRARHDVL